MPMAFMPRSFAVAHQAHEDVLERALPGVQVLEADAEIAQALEQGRNALALLVGVEGVFQLAAAGLQRQAPVAQLRRDRGQRLQQVAASAASCRAFSSASIFSSTTISSPLLITPMRSAISSASSM